VTVQAVRHRNGRREQEMPTLALDHGLAAAPDITRAAYLFFLKPVIAAVLALWILQQPVSPMEWLAIVIICGAVAFEVLWPRLAERLGRDAAREA
jgi:hypothetical protein